MKEGGGENFSSRTPPKSNGPVLIQAFGNSIFLFSMSFLISFAFTHCTNEKEERRKGKEREKKAEREKRNKNEKRK